MAQEVVNKVRPAWIRNTDVSFSTFGGRRHGSKAKEFRLTLKGKGGGEEVSVELSQVPVICLPLSRPVVDAGLLENFEHLDLQIILLTITIV